MLSVLTDKLLKEASCSLCADRVVWSLRSTGSVPPPGCGACLQTAGREHSLWVPLPTATQKVLDWFKGWGNED